jgi:hypothetical protein
MVRPAVAAPRRTGLNIDAVQQAEEDFAYALGRFIMAWSDTETELYRALLHYSGVSGDVGRAIFSGTRAKTMVNFIRAIVSNTKAPKARVDDLDFIFRQLNWINDARDRFVHFSSETMGYKRDDPTVRLLTNRHRTSYVGKGYALPVSAKTLEDMTWDLYGITNHLQMHFVPQPDGFHVWEENEGERTTWRYKPPPQDNANQARPPKPPKPRPRQKPSRVKRNPEGD